MADCRKILYSPGFGAGWTTWAHSDASAVRRFMLEYQPFIDAVEAEGWDELSSRKMRLWYHDVNNDNFLRCPDDLNDNREAFRALCEKTFPGADMVCSIDLYPEGLDLAQFCMDFKAAFPGEDLPYLGGLGGITVMEVPKDARVRITEYDGSESVVVEGSDEGWL